MGDGVIEGVHEDHSFKTFGKKNQRPVTVCEGSQSWTKLSCAYFLQSGWCCLLEDRWVGRRERRRKGLICRGKRHIWGGHIYPKIRR